jgi:hypothetical protein
VNRNKAFKAKKSLENQQQIIELLTMIKDLEKIKIKKLDNMKKIRSKSHGKQNSKYSKAK